jgi:phosphoserine aminotransferase
MTERVYNFAAGPAALPLPVLEEVRRDLVSMPDRGMSILEMSHRSPTVIDIMDRAEEDIRRLADIPDNYRVLFLQGARRCSSPWCP